MQILGTYEKQPDEVVASGRWGIDWSNDLLDGETISTCTVAVYDSDGTDVTDTLTSGNVSINSAQTSVTFTGGNDGEEYIAEFQITTSGGSTLEAEVRIVVRELP